MPVDVSLRQDLAAGRQQQPLSSQLEYDTWAELLIKTNHNSFGRHDAGPKFGPWVRRTLPTPAAGDEFKPPPPPQHKVMAEPQHDSRKQMIESYRQEMMQMVRNMPKEEVEEVAAFELSFRDIVESPQPQNTQPEVGVAAATGENTEKMSKPRRESRNKNMGTTGLFLFKALMPLVLAAVCGHRKIPGGGMEKAAKVSPNPCQGKYEERSCSSRSSNQSSSGRISGRRASCYLFLHRYRSGPIHF